MISRRQVLGGAATALGAFAVSHLIASDDDESTRRTGTDESVPSEFTDQSVAAIRKGTAWLIKAINRDGGAGLDIGTTSDVACSSVVGMALMSQGHTPMEGDHKKRQSDLLNFLLNRVEGMGSSRSLQPVRSQIEGDLGIYATHFFSTLCLSLMLGESPYVVRCKDALTRLEQVVSGGQITNGSWGEDCWAPQLGTACGWLSLRAAASAGMKVSGSSSNAGDYLLRTMPHLGKQSNEDSWYHRFYACAAGLRVLYSLGREEEPDAKAALAAILDVVERDNRAFGTAGGEEYLTFHLLTEILMQMDGPNWTRWYPNVRDKLCGVQNRDGSWTGHHCITSRTFSTACALMVLSAPNRYLPISQI